jgi:hypothetical protein
VEGEMGRLEKNAVKMERSQNSEDRSQKAKQY